MLPPGITLRDCVTVYATQSAASGTLIAAKAAHRIVIVSMTVVGVAGTNIATLGFSSAGSEIIASSGWFQAVAANGLYQSNGVVIGPTGDSLGFARASGTGNTVYVVTYAYVPS